MHLNYHFCQFRCIIKLDVEEKRWLVISDKLQREVFHFLFLERLLKICDPKLFILKGGVNFRFFFQSPRYSEDIDLDVIGSSVETLKKNGYKILEDPSFIRSLKVFGISNILLNDKNKAKHTKTTQRFRLRLVSETGETFPTKVEFSRRDTFPSEPYSLEIINPKIALQFKRLSFPCYHYNAEAAALQKVRALAKRTETQARDVFDLYLLYLIGSFSKKNIIKSISQSEREEALISIRSLDYDSYLGHVVEYLEPEAKPHYTSKEIWNLMVKTIEENIYD